MTHSLPRSILYLVAAAALTASDLAAQRPRPRVDMPMAPSERRIDTSTFTPTRAVVRTPRAFVPFDTSTVSRRGSLDETVTINGRSMTRREFVHRANQLEAQLNASGYTLKGTQAVVRDAAVPLDTFRFAAQRRSLVGSKIAAIVRPTLQQRQRRLDVNPILPTATVIQLRQIDPQFAAALQRFRVFPAMTLDTASPPQLILPIVKNFSKSWDVGDRDVVAAGFSYSGKLTGDTTATSLEVGAEVDAWFFDRHGNIAEVEASANAPKAGAGGAQAEITVLGQRVYNKSLAAGTTILEGDVSKSLDYSVQTTVVIYGIPVTVRVGGRGTVGLSYGMGVESAAVTADVTPFASLQGYAEAGVTIWIAEAGAGANLTLLQLSIPVDGKLALVQELENDLWGIHRQLTVGYEVRALDGNVYAYVRVSHPCGWKFWETCHTRYDKTIFSWTGVRDSGTWFAHNDFVDLLAGSVTGPRAIAASYAPRPAVNIPSTLTFMANDAASGTPLPGTVAVAGQTVPTGQPITATFCKQVILQQAFPSWLNLQPAPRRVCLPATISAPGYQAKTIALKP